MSGSRWEPGARHLEGAGGLELHYRVRAVESPRAALLVVHGLFEHSRRYQELAEFMARAGIATFGLDLRGHGLSAGRRGHVSQFEAYLEDLDRFRSAVEETLPGTPAFLLGHSLGGVIGIRYLQGFDPSFAGAIISAPWLATTGGVPGWQAWLAGMLDRVFPTFPFPAGLDPDDLSHDPERVADYREDPLIFGTLTPRLWKQVVAARARAFEERDRIRVPILFLLPGADPIADPDRSLEFARSLPPGDVSIHLMDGYYHEVLQEPARAAVMAQILGWLEERLP